jgi:hypothetical protein
MPRKNTEAEAIASRQRRLIRQREYRKRCHKGANPDHPNQLNSLWTDERHIELVSLFEDPADLTMAEIGRRMGLTKNAIIGRIDRCQLSRYTGPTTMERLDAWNEAWATRNGREDRLPADEVLRTAFLRP